MTDKNGDNPRDENEQVRLITREEADAAIKQGSAVGRQKLAEPTMKSDDPIVMFPTVIGNDTETIDLRTVADKDGNTPEDNAPQMPHWTEPGTGEVPVAFGADETPETNGPRMRLPHNIWDDNGVANLDDLGQASQLGEAAQVGSDEDQTPEEIEASALGTRFRLGDTEASVTEHPLGDDPRPETYSIDTVSLTKRVITGGAFAVAALVAFSVGPIGVLVLAAAVMLFAGAEYFDGVRRAGFKPATVLGLLAIGGLVAGSYARGEGALPLVLGMTLLFSFLWYLTGVIKDRPTSNIAVTMLGVVWIGIFGSYAALLLRMPNRAGMAFLIGAVLVTITYDTAAYLGGSMFGRHKLSPAISPNKSWEGLGAGTIGALVVGMLVGAFISPWGIASGLLLGVVVSAVAPLGDLAESMIKRDLGLKDMGRILPGHGGVLDRFDAMLLVFPATYYLVLALNI